MFERFTEDARRAVVSAHFAAQCLGDKSIGTEHLLLGIVINQSGISSRVLDDKNISFDAVYEQLKELRGGQLHPSPDRPISPDDLRHHMDPDQKTSNRPSHEHIPFSRTLKDALSAALPKAIELHDNFIDLEHLLLVLADSPECRAKEIFTRLGTSAPEIRTGLLLALPARESAHPPLSL